MNGNKWQVESESMSHQTKGGASAAEGGRSGWCSCDWHGVVITSSDVVAEARVLDQRIAVLMLYLNIASARA